MQVSTTAHTTNGVTPPPVRKSRARSKFDATLFDPNTMDVDEMFGPTEATLRGLAHQQMTGFVVLVTPALAQQWLASNLDNRSIGRAQVAALKFDINERRWRITHQGIAFSKSGRLIDGQHRLTAIIETGTPSYLTVFIDMEDDMFGALDRNKRRSVADELGDDHRYVDPCTWLMGQLRTYHIRISVVPEEVKTVLDVYRATLVDMMTVAPSNAKYRTTASIRAAVMVRVQAAHGAARALLLEQWGAFARLQVEQMDKSTGALLRRIDKLANDANPVAIANERAAAVWTAFNPALRSLGKIQVRDATETVDTLCGVARQQITAFKPEVLV